MDEWYGFVENITLQKVFHHLSSLPTVLPLQFHSLSLSFSLSHSSCFDLSLFTDLFLSPPSNLKCLAGFVQITVQMCLCFEASAQIWDVTNREPKAKISETRHLKHYSFIIFGFLSEIPRKNVRSASHDHLNGCSLLPNLIPSNCVLIPLI